MARLIRRSAASIIFPVATQPGRSGTEAPHSLSGSLLMRTRYSTFLMTSPGERLACPPAAIPGLDIVPTVAVSVLICRKTAILDRVFVEDVLRDSVRRPLKPRLVVCYRSRHHRPGSLG